jgi:hypothetical protein
MRRHTVPPDSEGTPVSVKGCVADFAGTLVGMIALNAALGSPAGADKPNDGFACPPGTMGDVSTGMAHTELDLDGRRRYAGLQHVARRPRRLVAHVVRAHGCRREARECCPPPGRCRVRCAKTIACISKGP